MGKAKKVKYNAYRVKLTRLGIHSYIDFNGNTFTSCKECLKADCPSKSAPNGCMAGELPDDIKKKILN